MTPDELERLVTEQVGDQVELTWEANLLDLGLDSVRLMMIADEIERRGGRATFVQLAEAPTLAAWSRLL